MADNKAEVRGTPIFRYMTADYLDVGENGSSDIRVMSVFTGIDENTNQQTVDKHYTGDKNASKFTTSNQPQFPITADMYKDNIVTEYLRDIAEEGKIGVSTDFYRVRLYQPITGKDNTYYARKFRVGVEVSGIAGSGGEIMNISGNLNGQGDVVIGEFNTETRVFTAKDAAVTPVPVNAK